MTTETRIFVFSRIPGYVALEVPAKGTLIEYHF